jgi:hypothetical protein
MNRRWRGGVGGGTTESADLTDTTERAHRVNHKLLDLISVVSVYLSVSVVPVFIAINNGVTRIH